MNLNSRIVSRSALIGLMLCCAAFVNAANLEQTITLQPGWNAVYVELEPEEKDISALFAGLPIASVWRWMPDSGGAQFIRDPAEGLENVDGWFAWFPEPRPEAFLTNLFRISGQTAYLVKLEGGTSRQITIVGKPRVLPIAWQANAFTLTGLPVSPDSPPSFGEFFSASAAHQAQPIYRLSPNGQWQLLDSGSSTAIEPGVAYWIYTAGNSRYQGRMNVVLDRGESVEFGRALDEIQLVLRNRSGVNSSFQIERLTDGALPMLFKVEDPETGEIGWPRLQQTLVLDAPDGADVFVDLGIERSQLSADRMEEIFAITDELGQRILVHAGGNSAQPGAAALAASKGAGGPKAATGSFAGLWVGEVAIDGVSQAQQAGTTPTPAYRPFSQRFMIHVNGVGQARLLKDVIQMWEEGTYVPSSIDPTLNEVDQPGRYVLLTDKSLIGLYVGAANRDGASVGIRYSTIAYDFEGDTLDFNGSFGPGGELSASIVVGTELPTNPFLHRYHPDHDNKDAEFLNFRAEAYQVVRSVQLVFASEDPLGRDPPGWGDSIVGGTFSEAITGLHKNAIFTSGQFRLRRVSAVATLNQ